jgi:hypothetical protein
MKFEHFLMSSPIDSRTRYLRAGEVGPKLFHCPQFGETANDLRSCASVGIANLKGTSEVVRDRLTKCASAAGSQAWARTNLRFH